MTQRGNSEGTGGSSALDATPPNGTTTVRLINAAGRPCYPFSAVVGADDAKLALLLTAVDPYLGGVLLRGHRGCGKSTLARALAPLLPASAPFVELPVGATVDRLVGTVVTAGTRRTLVPGILAEVDGGLLYCDEINLLPDVLVDALLDAASSGVNRLERNGASAAHLSRFVLVGSMDPDEGEPRPQLLDRFGLSVSMRAPADTSARAEAVRRRLAFESDPEAFVNEWRQAEAILAARIQAARPAAVPNSLLRPISRMCSRLNSDGLRGDVILARAAAALAGWEGRSEVAPADVERVAAMVLGHRSRTRPYDVPVLEPTALRSALGEAFPGMALGPTDQATTGGFPSEQGPEPAVAAPPHSTPPQAASTPAFTPPAFTPPASTPPASTPPAAAEPVPAAPAGGTSTPEGSDTVTGTAPESINSANSPATPRSGRGPDIGQAMANSEGVSSLDPFVVILPDSLARPSTPTPVVESAPKPLWGSVPTGPVPTVASQAGTNGSSKNTITVRDTPSALDPEAVQAAPPAPPADDAPAEVADLVDTAEAAAAPPFLADTPAPSVHFAPIPLGAAPSAATPPTGLEPDVPASTTGDDTDLPADAAELLTSAHPEHDFTEGVPQSLSMGSHDDLTDAHPSSLLVLTVDTSGSAGADDRLDAARGAIIGFLADAHEGQHQVAMITFGGDVGAVVLPPTGSVEVARDRLADLSTGGRTPLAAGIEAALEVATQCPGGAGMCRPLLVLVSDGRATSAPEGVDPVLAALAAADRVARCRVDAVVVDAEAGPNRSGLAHDLAARMGATYLTLADLSPQSLEAAMRSLALV